MLLQRAGDIRPNPKSVDTEVSVGIGARVVRSILLLQFVFQTPSKLLQLLHRFCPSQSLSLSLAGHEGPTNDFFFNKYFKSWKVFFVALQTLLEFHFATLLLFWLICTCDQLRGVKVV